MSIFSGRSAKTYKVDYCGDESFYEGAKPAYPAGEKVTLYYTLIATDTNYSFFLDGEPVKYEWVIDKGIAVSFVMLEHDIKLECRMVNSMCYNIPD